MSKKEYKRKRSKILTKQRKNVQEPHEENMIQGLNHNTMRSKRVKKS